MVVAPPAAVPRSVLTAVVTAVLRSVLAAVLTAVVLPLLTVVLTDFVVLVDLLSLLHEATVNNRPTATAPLIKVFMMVSPSPARLVLAVRPQRNQPRWPPGVTHVSFS